MSDYTGKVVLVTAAGAGIGRESALEFGRRGASVVVGELDEKLGDQTAADIVAANGQAVATVMDATDVTDIKRALALAESTYGGLDILVNVCGGTRFFGTVEEASEDEWNITIDTNLNTVYRCSKYAIPMLRARGGGVGPRGEQGTGANHQPDRRGFESIGGLAQARLRWVAGPLGQALGHGVGPSGRNQYKGGCPVRDEVVGERGLTGLGASRDRNGTVGRGPQR